MRLKLTFLALFLLGTSAAHAGTCVDCFGAGDPDPSGIITSLSSHCYFQDSGKFGSCLPKELSNTCTTTNATYCPTKTNDSGGGGTGGGGGGSECDTSFGGYCDPECMECGGGSGMLF